MNFLFRKHKIIFIHIPKNGGTTVRKVLEAGRPRGAQGIIPLDWGDLPTFSIVRNPTDRFLSGLNMFKFGTPDVGGHYAEARWPELTPARALEVLEDDTIPYDRAERSLPANLRHHIWPQTEPFFCLSRADHVLRFENFDEEFEGFLRQYGIEKEIPHLRHTIKNPQRVKREDLSEAELARIEKFYARDFRELGYEPVTDIPKSPPLHISSDPLRETWRIYFENITCRKIKTTEVLPEPTADLEAFLNERIPGDRAKTWAKRKGDLLQHFQHLEPEFRGCLRISHLLACVIVCIRRDAENEAAQELFHRIISEHGTIISEDMNLRWLVSVCDTIVDTGKSDTDRAIALIGTLAAGTVKAADTERMMFNPLRTWPPKYRFSRGGSLYDGVIQFWVRKGDMLNNLMQRAASVLETPSVASPFAAEILQRLQKEDTLISRMQSLRGVDSQIPAPERLKKAISDAVEKESGTEESSQGMGGRIRRLFKRK